MTSIVITTSTTYNLLKSNIFIITKKPLELSKLLTKFDEQSKPATYLKYFINENRNSFEIIPIIITIKDEITIRSYSLNTLRPILALQEVMYYIFVISILI